ncbi:Rieske domain protein [Cordyceps fumosorosea ARSEF 2679]|uniref:Rieske domain protein n=1 Tax=Cordyceps fumosorosea (strain ARSEF 2679) TaxID=1081104 RepID=A0A167RJZ7_CORFA|nr:Rieske domain protein [Cordyceps fumosorosea ARSEF 2679]OAA58669.1 Rieske domain protein [Cordyceps fumosorosea ARSEF 2679]
MSYTWPRARPDAQWIPAGPLAQFPDVAGDDGNLIQPRRCDAKSLPGCRILHVPKTDPSKAAEIAIPAGAATSPTEGQDLKDQVLVFRYRDRMHAVDHQCPHNAYPLSNGTAFDIEDFGVVLSAALTCPKHGWSFDIFTGQSDRGSYKLPVWEIQVRDAHGDPWSGSLRSGTLNGETVWVRRRQRIG